jgi:Pentapeptide repeats (8 copies)
MLDTIKSWRRGLPRSSKRWLMLAVIATIAIIVWLAYLMIVRGYAWPESGFEGKTIWDWLGLLIIPIVLGVGALLFNRSERRTELKVADDRQKEQALQSYIDKMTELMIDDRLLEYRDYLGEPVVKVAQIRTVTTLRALDIDRKNILLQFLFDSGLADFILVGASLKQANLSGADLSGANLSGANLNEANLNGANLKGANLSGANLSGAWLMQANLSGANLIGAGLSGARLMEANLRLTNLSGANLSGADLTSAKVTDKQMTKAKSLKGATMPDGTKQETESERAT